jgi:hypothetical protein
VGDAEEADIQDCFAKMGFLFTVCNKYRVQAWVDSVRIDKDADLAGQLEKVGEGAVL